MKSRGTTQGTLSECLSLAESSDTNDGKDGVSRAGNNCWFIEDGA